MDFGAFVDIGLHDDGLVHISRMSLNRINHPSEVVSVSDIVKVYVYEVDEVNQGKTDFIQFLNDHNIEYKEYIRTYRILLKEII